MQIGRRFGLRDQPADGVFCGEHGLFVGKIPLLERRENGGWQPRPPSELNRDLGERYGVPIAVNEKLNSPFWPLRKR